jgi:DNA primase
MILRDFNLASTDEFDVISYLESTGIAYSTSGKNISEGWIGINCPFADCTDPSDHMGIAVADVKWDNGFYTCWICGRKGGAIKLIQTIEDCNYFTAKQILDKHQSFLTSVPMQPLNERRRTEKFELEHCTPIDPSNIPSHIKSFLISRGFNPTQVVQEYKLHYGGCIGEYKYRIVLPIEYNGNFVSCVARDITGKQEPPYRNCPDERSSVPLKETLYGYDQIHRNSNIIVVEGPLDQWRLGTGAVATFGTNYTSEQILLLKELQPRQVYVLYDREKKAQAKAMDLARHIHFAPTQVLVLEHKNDPAELTNSEVVELRQELLL